MTDDEFDAVFMMGWRAFALWPNSAQALKANREKYRAEHPVCNVTPSTNRNVTLERRRAIDRERVRRYRERQKAKQGNG